MNQPRYRVIQYSSVVGTGVLDNEGKPHEGNLIVVLIPPSANQAECERVARVCSDALNAAEAK